MFSFSFSFSVSHFSIFFQCKLGATPLYIAAGRGYEEVVQLLLEKGKANVDLPTKVLLLIVFFFFFFFFFSFSFSIFFQCKGRRNPSLYCCFGRTKKKLFKFYWKKEKQTLIFQMRFLCYSFIILNLLILFLQSLHWSGGGGGWILIDIYFVFYFLKILFF